MMDELILVAPSMAYEEQILAYRGETLAIEPALNGSGGLDPYEQVADWLAFLQAKADPATCPKPLVPDSTFLCVREADDRLVGMVNIRHKLNDWLNHYGGHIGYSIRPDERGKGYSKQQLRLALQESRRLGLTRVLLTCREDNLPSRRCIEACGGRYEDTREKPDGERMRRYWIDI